MIGCAKVSLVLIIALLEISHIECFGRQRCPSCLFNNPRLLKHFAESRGGHSADYAPVEYETELIDRSLASVDHDADSEIDDNPVQISATKDTDVEITTDAKSDKNVEVIHRVMEIPASLASKVETWVPKAKIPFRKEIKTLGTNTPNWFNQFPTGFSTGCTTGSETHSPIYSTFQLTGTNTINNNYSTVKCSCQENTEPESWTLRSTPVRRRRNIVPEILDYEENMKQDQGLKQKHTEEEFELNPEAAGD